ncbi:MAG TPA: hypothetical protein VIX35_12000 [Vicinamibacterales bacterium]
MLLLAGATALAPAWPRAEAPAGQKPEVPALLASAGSYLDAYEHKFSAVVAREDYALTMMLPPPSSGGTGRTVRRALQSDVMMLNLGPAEWVAFRDVDHVDGRAVHDSDSRLETLLLKPSADVLRAAHQIANESARYNIGVPRNFNVPTMALAYLGRHNQTRSKFTIKTTEKIDDMDTVVVEFQETANPGLITAALGAVSTRGRFWIVPSSGAIPRTELSCRVDRGTSWVEGTVSVTYKLEPSLDVLVPARMDETYRRDTGESDAGQATYADFRMFNVDTKAIKHGGGGR